MQQYETSYYQRRREPCVALTEAQRADYEYMMDWAESLCADGKLDEARRIRLVAAKIVRTGAPALD